MTVPLLVVGDPGRLRQIVMNLVGNAVKFTSKGEVGGLRDDPLTITSNSDHPPHRERHRQSVFRRPSNEQFSKHLRKLTHPLTRKFGGTGLGLAISSHLVRTDGWPHFVESEVGSGSTFHVYSPLRREHPRHRNRAPSRHARTRRRSGAQLTRAFSRRWSAVGEWNLPSWTARHPQQAAMRTTSYDVLVIDCALTGRLRARTGESYAVTWQSFCCCRHSRARRRSSRASWQLTPSGEAVRAVECDLPERPRGRGGLSQKPPWTRESQHLRILLAEDNPVNQRVAVRLFEKRGHQVAVAEDGTRLLAMLERGSYDVILMDLQMPVRGGLRDDNRNSPSRARGGGRIHCCSHRTCDEGRSRALHCCRNGRIPSPKPSESAT